MTFIEFVFNVFESWDHRGFFLKHIYIYGIYFISKKREKRNVQNKNEHNRYWRQTLYFPVSLSVITVLFKFVIK